LLLLLLLAGALAWWLTRPGDAVVELRAHHGPLVSLEREAVAGLGAGLERWALIGEGRDTVSALWRRGAHPEPEWVVVLLGGIGTDDRAALLVPAELPVGVLAVSWPWKGSRRMSQVEFLARTHELRAALLETPGAIARGVEAARRAHPRSRVALIGASLGVPPTVAALALAKPDALVLVDGAADLARLLRSEVRRQLGQNAAAGLAAGPAAALGGRLLSSLEPSRFGAQGRDVPVLLVDAAEEERYPRACVERLHATFPHATRATHPGHHIRPENEAQVASVIGQAVAWLESLPRPATAAR
jgi:hypothetical protein